MFSTPHSTRARRRLPAPAQLWLLYSLFLVAGIAQAAIVPLLPRLSAHYALSASQAALLLALPGLATLAVSLMTLLPTAAEEIDVDTVLRFVGQDKKRRAGTIRMAIPRAIGDGVVVDVTPDDLMAALKSIEKV